MSRLMNTIRSAMGYAHNKEIAAQLDVVLKSHENDLEDVGYESSTTTEDAMKELERIMDDIDENAVTKRAELRELQAEAREAAEEEESE